MSLRHLFAGRLASDHRLTEGGPDVAHATEVQREARLDAEGRPTGVVRRRWYCSGCDASGRWHDGEDRDESSVVAERRAKLGGDQHVRASRRRA